MHIISSDIESEVLAVTR